MLALPSCCEDFWQHAVGYKSRKMDVEKHGGILREYFNLRGKNTIQRPYTVVEAKLSPKAEQSSLHGVHFRIKNDVLFTKKLENNLDLYKVVHHVPLKLLEKKKKDLLLGSILPNFGLF